MPYDPYASDWLAQLKSEVSGDDQSSVDRKVLVVKVPLSGGTDTGGGIGSWKNPEPVAVVIERVVVDVTVVATAACNLDVGTTATSATTSSDNLIDGLDVHTAVTTSDNVAGAGANGKGLQHLAAGKWVTFSTGDAGASAGLKGNAYIHYVVT